MEKPRGAQNSPFGPDMKVPLEDKENIYPLAGSRWREPPLYRRVYIYFFYFLLGKRGFIVANGARYGGKWCEVMWQTVRTIVANSARYGGRLVLYVPK